MRIGYARVSTQEQNLDLQIDSLTQAGCKEIYKETISGTTKHRPEFEHCIKSLRQNDTLVIWKLDRLGRNTIDLLHIIEQLKKNEIDLIVLTENIDTTTSIGKVMFGLQALLAEYERDKIHERTMAGLKAARARGRKGGRRPKLNTTEIDQLIKLYENQTLPVQDLVKRFWHIKNNSAPFDQTTTI